MNLKSMLLLRFYSVSSLILSSSSASCRPKDGGGGVVVQLQAEPGGGLAGAHQLHCSGLRMQRSEVKREACL